MEIIVRPNRDSAIALAARLVEEQLRAKPDLVLGCATGRTMEQLYDLLVASGVSFAQAATFNLDEYIGLSPEDPRSYSYYMKERLFSRVDIDPARTHLPDGNAADPTAAGRDYERLIEAAGGLDLQLLGIGEAGHIGFNEPLSSMTSRTRDKTLTPMTRRQNAEMFGGDPENVPSRAMTMGVGTILEARELVLLACGESKAEIVARALEGPLTASVSASAIQLHRNCIVILDDEAASKLSGREYYDFVFQNEPRWADYQ